MTHFNIIFYLCIELPSSSLLWGLQDKRLCEFINSQCVQHVPPISISLSFHCNKNSTNYEPPHYVAFSTLNLLHPSEINILASCFCSLNFQNNFHNLICDNYSLNWALSIGEIIKHKMRWKHGHDWKQDTDIEGGEFKYYSRIWPDWPEGRND